MKTLLLVLCLLGSWGGMVRAGGPEIELDKAHVDDVTFDERGLVLKVTGTVKFFAKIPEDDPANGNANGNAKWVTLTMRGGEIRYHGVNLDATSTAGSDKYRARILAMEGHGAAHPVVGYRSHHHRREPGHPDHDELHVSLYPAGRRAAFSMGRFEG